MSYTPFYPPAFTLGAHVCNYFRINPEESLSTADIVCKFDITAREVIPLLAACVAQALLTRTKHGTAYVFSAGPALPMRAVEAHSLATSQALPVATPASPQATAKARVNKSRFLPPLDVQKLKIETGVVQPGKPPKKWSTRYDSIFERLTAAGQSVEVPLAYHPSIDKARAKYSIRFPATEFRVRKVSATASRVFRIA